MIGEAASGGACLGQGFGIHDGMEVGFDGGLIGDPDLVEDIPDLVRPAALDGDVGVDDRQGGEQACAAVDADHVEGRAGKSSAVEIGEKLLPLGRAFAGGQAEVDDLLLAVGPEAEGDEHRTTDRAGAGLAGQHHAIEHENRY